MRTGVALWVTHVGSFEPALSESRDEDADMRAHVGEDGRLEALAPEGRAEG